MPKCPKCQTLFAEEEGPTCDCYRERECPDCTETFDPELFPEIRGCFDHEDRLTELRELAFQEWQKGKRQEAQHKKWFEWKDKRIFELETSLKEKEGLIVELHALLAASLERRNENDKAVS